jgi:hypothetical protein
MADALPFRCVLLLSPLIQLSLHGLQRVPGVLLSRRRSMRSGRRCWSNRRGDGLLRLRRASNLTLKKSKAVLSLSDVEDDGIWSGMRRSHVLLLGRLRLRRRQPHLLLLMGRHGIVRDESSDPSERLNVLRRSPHPLEAGLEHP